MMKTTAISCTLAALASLSSVLAVVPIHCDYVKESITYVANGAPEITYNGNWKFLSNQGAQDLSGVEAYALDPTAYAYWPRLALFWILAESLETETTPLLLP